LYRALSEDGNPELDTFIKVVKALGLQLHATPKAG
jgi:probable addiction module antidote protein